MNDLGTFFAHVVDTLVVFVTRLAPVVDILIILTAPRVDRYRQRLNGPNVKITTRRTAGFSRLVALLRGPGEQPGCTPTSDGHRQRQRGRGTTEEEP